MDRPPSNGDDAQSLASIKEAHDDGSSEKAKLLALGRDDSALRSPSLNNNNSSAMSKPVGIDGEENGLYGACTGMPFVPDASPTAAVVAKPTYYRAVFTTISVFAGYSAMIVLQDKIKTKLGIETGSEDAYVFGVGVSFLYLGNLIFRLLHNVLFTCLKPRRRVMLSYTCMTLSQLTLVLPYYVFDSKHLVFVFLAYMMAGVAIGTFESNLISCLTPLGDKTKSWAVVGIPIGFNAISVGSFGLFAAWPDDVTVQAGVYWFVAALNLAGLVLYVSWIPNIEFEASKDTFTVFIADLKKFRDWLPEIWRHCLALMVDMFTVSIFSAIATYIFDVDDVPLWPKSEHSVPKNAFLAVYYLCSFSGDFFSRRIAYRDKPRNPLAFLLLSVIGAGLVLSKTALVAPVGMFCVMFANGTIYANTTRWIDAKVHKKFNLIALSAWLFVGDIGSFVGAQITQPLRTGVGGVDMPPSPANSTAFAPSLAMMILSRL